MPHLLENATAFVTGATSGFGRAIAERFVRDGARVVVTGRRAERLAKLARDLGDRALPVVLDVRDRKAIESAVAALPADFSSIDVLVNNAGLVAGGRRLTEDGLERTIAVNHLAPFLLTNLLLDRLRQSAPARVITTSSDAHRSGHMELDDLNGERHWSTWSAYGNSKLANVLFTRALAKRLRGSGVVANCLHPGVIRTGLGRGARLPVRIGWRVAAIFFAGPRKGASTIVHLADSEEGGRVSGQYFVDSRPATPSLEAQDDELAERLWDVSRRLTGLG